MSDGIYYEDLVEGLQVETPARTITESDIVSFAALSGDYNVIHTDAETAAQGPFGQRIAHGLLGLAATSGLITRVPKGQDPRLVAFLGLSWEFRGPIFIGDTIHAVQTVASRRTTKRPGMGIVNFDIQVINQRGETVQEGQWKVMYMMRNVE